MFNVFSISVRSRIGDVSYNDAYNPTASLGPHENPPFYPGFYILKLKINETEIVKSVKFEESKLFCIEN